MFIILKNIVELCNSVYLSYTFKISTKIYSLENRRQYILWTVVAQDGKCLNQNAKSHVNLTRY